MIDAAVEPGKDVSIEHREVVVGILEERTSNRSTGAQSKCAEERYGRSGGSEKYDSVHHVEEGLVGMGGDPIQKWLRGGCGCAGVHVDVVKLAEGFDSKEIVGGKSWNMR